jgi:hypothetical protein
MWGLNFLFFIPFSPPLLSTKLNNPIIILLLPQLHAQVVPLQYAIHLPSPKPEAELESIHFTKK